MNTLRILLSTTVLITTAFIIPKSIAQSHTHDAQVSNHAAATNTMNNSQSNGIASQEKTTAPQIFKPTELKWSTPIENVPQNVEMATLIGDPMKSGPFIIRVRLPKNFQMQPHFATVDQYVTILSGNVNMGIGDKFDKTTASNLPKESFVVMPAEMHHYLWSEEGAVVQVSGEGPLKINFVNPQDNPAKTMPARTAKNNG